MTVETSLVTAVAPLLSGRFYADLAALDTPRPYGTYQQIGGQVVEFLEGGAAIKRNARIQINVWADTRQAANELMRSIEDLLQSSPFFGQPIGALLARFEESTRCYGAQQDFSLWWP